MQKRITSFLLIGLILLTSSCASILSKSNYPISINSSPSEAQIVVTNKKGVEVYAGNTPATLKLDASSGFFGKEHYQVKFKKNGFQSKTVPINFKLDGWYFGNLLLGGVIGMLIVDPATGAMYKLDTEFLNETLLESTANVEKEKFQIYGLAEIPNDWNDHLVLVAE